MRNRSIVLFMVLAVLAFTATGVPALDGSVLTGAAPEVMSCMETLLGKDAVDALRRGEVPEAKRDRKRFMRAYQTCSGAESGDEAVHSYDGPIFDAMSQIDESVDMDAAMERVRAAGVTRLGLFARSRHRLRENEDAVLALARRNPDLVVLGAPKYFLLSGDLSDDYIRATVEGIRRHGYRFIGEILYTHGDKQSGKQYASGERYVDPSKPGTARLLKAIAPLRIPLMVHFEPYAPERDFPRLHALFSAWPDQIFLVPHMGFCSPAQVEEFLSRHPNLYMVTSKKERLMSDWTDPAKQAMAGSAFLNGSTLRPEWKDILVRYQDRLIFGTDPHRPKLWERYGQTMRIQRLVLGQLPPGTAEKIAHINAERLYGVGPTP